MNDTEARQRLEEVLPGATILPLAEGETVEKAFLLLHCRDSDGDGTWSFRTTSPFDLEQLLGALTIQVDLVRRQLLDAWSEV